MKALSFVEGELLIPSMPKGRVFEEERCSVLGKSCGRKFLRKKWPPGNGSEVRA